ncbi:DUF1515 domain-containing protein [Mesorhizobium opportunistum]|uniref:DUF1515 family protein n=1 Tax=Mesorhizobium opportunistum TaxID=593909 RepID=UPI003339ACD1
MPTSGPKSLEMMIGGLLQATQDMQRDITEIRRDIKDSDARAALSYEQSEQRAAASRSRLYERVTATETAVSKLNTDMTSVKEVTAEVTRWKLMGLGALGVTGMAAAAVASLVTAYWHDIWRVLRGG